MKHGTLEGRANPGRAGAWSGKVEQVGNAKKCWTYPSAVEKVLVPVWVSPNTKNLSYLGKVRQDISNKDKTDEV